MGVCCSKTALKMGTFPTGGASGVGVKNKVKLLLSTIALVKLKKMFKK